MRLPYDEAGAGSPVVLLHAAVGDRRMWEDELPHLAAAGFRAIALDLPGFGEAPVTPVSAPWLDVLETLDALGIERAALVGNSYGGAVALRVAVVAPERVTALALISAPPPGLEPSEELEAAWAAEGEARDRGDLEGAVRAVVDAWTLADAPEALRERVAAMERHALEVQDAVGEPTEAPDPLEDAERQLAGLATPALVLAGEHDMVDFRAGAETLARQLASARHAVLAGAGHLAPLERPAELRALLLGFLRDPGGEPVPRRGA
jgi:pimeloyl-ACP methyl ester carboxylesterase